MQLLKQYGANDFFLDQASLYPNWILARIVTQHKDLYKIVTESSEGFAEVSGKFRYEVTTLSDFPAVGDFVMVDRSYMENGNAIIQKCLPRKSAFERPAVGLSGQIQVIAANMDLIFLCMSLNADYNLNRLERYLSVAWNSGAIPVVLLTKADLCNDLQERLLEIFSIAPGTDVLATSYQEQDSWERVLRYLQPGVTASFIGSSGVGKSTLINRLAGQELLATSGIRQDDKGRHTTTRRELFLLPQGGIVIDTPGIRELGADSADVSKSFTDIDELIDQCRFRDCSHQTEPGCAVLYALEAGTLDPRRFESYSKLQKEMRYTGLSAKQIETEKINTMFGGMGNMKQLRDFVKNKNKRK